MVISVSTLPVPPAVDETIHIMTATTAKHNSPAVTNQPFATESEDDANDWCGEGAEPRTRTAGTWDTGTGVLLLQ
jgi:hypothetical protein